jgi:hypothetical protein
VHSKLVDRVNTLIDNHELDADNVIAEILNECEVAKISKKLYKSALKRFHAGRPPGKKKVTLGDELNWEFLLSAIPQTEDLHLVSLDGDFSSPRNKKRINTSLSKEWTKKKESTLHFYLELNDFFNTHIPEIKLAGQERLDNLILKLLDSGSYARTHSIIAEFPLSPEFSDKQILNLKEVFDCNSQVSDIHNDADVNTIFEIVKKGLKSIKNEDGPE